jgi:DNA-3-methyladenine glycosylase II
MKRSVFNLEPNPPYDFHLTGASAAYFRESSGVDTFKNGVFYRLLDLEDVLCLASVRSLGTVDSPSLEVEINGAVFDSGVLAKAKQRVAWILGINQDLIPFYDTVHDDPTLAKLVQSYRGLHVTHAPSVYEALVLAIVGQQVSSHVARILRTSLIETYGPSQKVSGIVHHAFPRPLDLVKAGVEGLRALKFSARKAQYMVDISHQLTKDNLDLEGLRAYSQEEVVPLLTKIRGVGSWTANWVLIRALGHNDGFPHSDLALCRTLGLLNGNKPFTPEEALKYSRKLSPFRSYFTTYLFAAIRSGYFSDIK